MPRGVRVNAFCKCVEQEYIKAVQKNIITGTPCLIIRQDPKTVTAYVSNGEKSLSRRISNIEIVQSVFPPSEHAKLFFNMILFRTYGSGLIGVDLSQTEDQ